MRKNDADDRFMTRDEVADLFEVTAKTIDRWAKAGKLGTAVVITPGGKRKYKRAQLTELAAGNGFAGM